MTTYIRFDKEHKIEVTEEPPEIHAEINAAGAANVPLIKLTRLDESPVWVNAREIRTISVPGEA